MLCQLWVGGAISAINIMVRALVMTVGRCIAGPRRPSTWARDEAMTAPGAGSEVTG